MNSQQNTPFCLTVVLAAMWYVLFSSKQEMFVRSAMASPNILYAITDAVFGELGVISKNARPVGKCKRLPPHNNLVRTYLWRISPRRDIVGTRRPSYIFGLPGIMGRFDPRDPNMPFTSKYAKKAFEKADVYVGIFDDDGYSLKFFELMAACARLPRNQTLDQVLSANVMANLSALWNELFFVRQPSFFSRWIPSLVGSWSGTKQYDSVKQWRDKSFALLHEVINGRVMCLRNELPLMFDKSSTSESSVLVGTDYYLREKAKRAGKTLLNVEHFDELCNDWFHVFTNEVVEAWASKAIRFWQNISRFMPLEQYVQKLEQEATDLYACGKLTQALVDDQCIQQMRFIGSGAPFESVEKSAADLCMQSSTIRPERVANRLDQMIRLRPDESIFYAMPLGDLPMGDDGDEFETESVMGKLRLRGYRVDELYVPQNSTDDERFSYL